VFKTGAQVNFELNLKEKFDWEKSSFYNFQMEFMILFTGESCNIESV
jgi:hypothetical protein